MVTNHTGSAPLQQREAIATNAFTTAFGIWAAASSLPCRYTFEKPTGLSLKLVKVGVCYYAIQLFNHQLTANLVDTRG